MGFYLEHLFTFTYDGAQQRCETTRWSPLVAPHRSVLTVYTGGRGCGGMLALRPYRRNDLAFHVMSGCAGDFKMNILYNYAGTANYDAQVAR